MKPVRCRRIGFASCLALGFALGSAAPAHAQRIKEVFEVGASVYVRALTVEPARGALWVGTSAGVHEVDLGSTKVRNTFTRKEGLANEYVFAVGLDRDGNKWFGTNAGGVSRYKDGRWKTFFPMHGLADYWVYSFAQQRNGDFWIGTWAGVNKFNPKSGKFSTYVKELVNEWVYGIAVDALDRVWFGTEGGVSMFDGRQWRAWTHADGLGAPNAENLPFSANTGLGTRARHDLSVGAEGPATYNPNYVFSIIAAADGSIWAGTWGAGASRWDGKAWTNHTAKDGLAGNIVYSIVQARDGALWFGTNHGVSRWDGKAFKNFGVADGLLDRNVYALAAAPNGEIWAGTKRGVVRISN
jgi:ligand-binding sensor domain-containing protein